MFGELRDIVENELVGVSQLIELLLVGVGHNTTDDLGDCVVKLGVTTEFLPLLSILMLICHVQILVVIRGSKTLSAFLLEYNIISIYFK